MAYLAPAEFVTKMVDAGESKIFMSTRDTVIRAYMAGAILALAAAFAVTITVQTGQPLAGVSGGLLHSLPTGIRFTHGRFHAHSPCPHR
jgi:formate/nitrite transporter FocA (FNT family)